LARVVKFFAPRGTLDALGALARLREHDDAKHKHDEREDADAKIL
jgi:hypothetical protein